MKHIAIVALAVALLAVGAWLGVPLYAQHRFEASLDLYVAERGDDRVGYRDAVYDYWNSRATLGEFSDLAMMRIGEQPAQMLLSATDVVIEGIDLEAGGNDASTPLASRVSWSGLSGKSDDDAMSFSTDAGEFSGVSTTQSNLTDAISTGGVSFDEGTLGPARFKGKTATGEISADVESVRMRAWRGQGADELALTGMSLDVTSERGGQNSTIALRWDDLVITDVVRGEPTLIGRVEQKGLSIAFDLPVPAVPSPAAAGAGSSSGSGAAPATPAAPVRGSVKFDEMSADKLRVDEQSVAAYMKLVDDISALDGKEPTMEEVAVWAESLLVLLERAQQLAVGAESVAINGTSVDLPKLQQQTIERMALTGQRGLKIERIESANQEQTDFLGNHFVTQSAVISKINFSALPTYLRKVLGSPVTAESLSAAGEQFIGNLTAGDLPPLDYGQWEMSGQTMKMADGRALVFDRMAWSPLTIDAEGRVSSAMSLGGITVPLSDIPAADPNAQAAVAALRAQGMESLIVGFDFSTQVDIKQGSVAVEGLSVGVDKLVEVGLDTAMSGLDIAALAQLPPEQRAGAAMTSTVFDGASITLRDDGLRQIAFMMMGQGGGASPEQVAEAMSGQVEQFMGSLGSARATSLGAAVARFVREGGSLRLKTAMGQPVPVVQVMQTMQTEGPPGLVELLALEAHVDP